MADEDTIRELLERMKGVEVAVEALKDAVVTRVDSLDARVTALEVRAARQNGAHESANLSGRVCELEDRVPDKLRDRLTSVEDQVPDKLIKRLDALERAVDGLVPVAKISVWIGAALGLSIIALIWSLITGQAVVTFP